MTEQKLDQMKKAFHLCRQIISLDVFFCIYDIDTTVLYMYPEDGDQDGVHLGEKFDDVTGGLQKVLATGEAIHNFIPLERFGFSMEGNVVPVFDGEELVGALSTAYIPMNQAQLAAQGWALQTVYSQVLSVDGEFGHFSTLFSDLSRKYLAQETKHFDAFCKLTAERVHEDYREEYLRFTNLDSLYENLAKDEVTYMDCSILDDSNEYRWYQILIKKIADYSTENTKDSYLYMVRDIHKSKSREMAILEENKRLIAQLKDSNEALFEQSVRDGLTGLYNRMGMQHFAQAILEKAKDRNLLVYALVIDLNGLKAINDKFGHVEGDKAIIATAKVLKESAAENSVVIRSGGDEFIVIDAFEANSDMPERIAENFKNNLIEYNESHRSLYNLHASYGWSFQKARTMADIESISKVADGEMYRMKNRYYESGKGIRRE